MSQFGMNMPGGARRGSNMNVYTGLMFLAVVSLATACVYLMFIAGPKIGKNGDAFGMQDIKEGIKLSK